jgi:hypothetical protein
MARTSYLSLRPPRREPKERAKSEKVDFYGNHKDLLCFALASAGISTLGIQQALQSMGIALTLSQINYRIGRAEAGREADELTQRTLFRQGRSPIAQALMAQVLGNRGIGQKVKQNAVEMLEKKDLYTPRPNGVLSNGQ